MNRHEPALDGLRGLAVAGVVCFHAGFSWAVGGFLGVSTFFTLSGFLITTQLVSWERVDLPLFWGRRARRLLPAALLTLLVVAALAPALGSASQLHSLRWDVVAALGYVANWRFLFAGQSYADLFAAPSPVLHFWSLAIEEQLYLVFPLLVAFVPRRRLAPVVGALVAGSVALSFALSSSHDAVYYGTFTRAGELLVGALLALVLPSVLGTGARRMWRPAVPRTAGVGALGVLVVLWGTTRQDTSWLYHGGFVLHAVLTAFVIAACVADGGVVRRALSFAPLRALGRISYGVYLIHWPVFVWWDAPFVAQVALTLVLALLSYVVVEQPIRLQRVRVPVALVPVAAVLCVGVVIASTLHPPKVETFSLAATKPPLPADPIVQAAPGAPVVSIFGDSTALRTGFALQGYAWTTGRIEIKTGSTDLGCPLARGGVVDYVSERREPDHARCDDWPTRWGQIVHDNKTDIAVVQIGPWDVADRRIDGHWTHIGEPAFDALLQREMSTAVDVLSSGGATVVWLTAPHIDFGRGSRGLPATSVAHISDPARIDRLNELLRALDAARPEMTVLDLAAHLRTLPGGEMDPKLRPDGVHFSEEASAQLVDWLAPAVLKAANR